jgi:hypothetical protein
VSTTEPFSPAIRARSAVLAMLQAEQIEATRDVGAFFPQPFGVLVGLPALTGRGLFSRTYEIPVLVVSGDPLNSDLATDRLYTLADECARALATDTYRPSSWRSSVNAEPLPAIELTVTATVTELED